MRTTAAEVETATTLAGARTWLAEGLSELTRAAAMADDQADTLGVLSDDLAALISRIDRLPATGVGGRR